MYLFVLYNLGIVTLVALVILKAINSKVANNKRVNNKDNKIKIKDKKDQMTTKSID